MIRRSIALAALAAWVLAPPAALAQPAARVEASLTFQGITTRFDHVLVVRQGNEEGMTDAPELRIFLSDQEIPRTVAGAATTLSAKQYAAEAKFNAVVIIADPAGAKLSGQASILNAPAMADGRFATGSSSNAFSRLSVSSGRASGKATFDSDDLKISAVFDAPVLENPVTADLKGAAALASAPAQAVLACTRVMHTRDLAAMAKVNTAARTRGLAEFQAQAGDQAFWAALKGEPDADAVAKTVQRVIVRGPNASVLLGEGTVAELVLENDGWKCD